jgi:aminoglycoside 6'-N-acetyltransferase I
VPFAIRQAHYPAEANKLLELWIALYPDAETPEIELEEMRRWFDRDDTATFVAVDAAQPDRLIGYADVGERPYADGCSTSPVAYLEAWYVSAEFRKQGIGKALMNAVVQWARNRGHTELASDTTFENTLSQRLHQKLGFEETDRIVQFRKRL